MQDSGQGFKIEMQLKNDRIHVYKLDKSAESRLWGLVKLFIPGIKP